MRIFKGILDLWVFAPVYPPPCHPYFKPNSLPIDYLTQPMTLITTPPLPTTTPPLFPFSKSFATNEANTNGGGGGERCKVNVEGEGAVVKMSVFNKQSKVIAITDIDLYPENAGRQITTSIFSICGNIYPVCSAVW